MEEGQKKKNKYLCTLFLPHSRGEEVLTDADLRMYNL